MEEDKNDIGRPTLFTPETIDKLEAVFLIGGTDLEACLYANVSKSAFYNYQIKNPDFVDRKEMLKETPFLKARKTIVESLNNPQYAFEYMKRKKKDEFSDRSELTGKDGEALNVSVLNYADHNSTPIST